VAPHLHIEQVLYKPDIVQRGWAPLETIDFKMNGVEGMRLTDAMDRYVGGLDGRDEPMFQSGGGVGNSVSCRIHVGGLDDSNFCYH